MGKRLNHQNYRNYSFRHCMATGRFAWTSAFPINGWELSIADFENFSTM